MITGEAAVGTAAALFESTSSAISSSENRESRGQAQDLPKGKLGGGFECRRTTGEQGAWGGGVCDENSRLGFY
jgi:hypothetical protein